ncbi:TPA: hypothetical protein OND32_004274 [Enterobacter asburiae]|nr:hypothetical protein [Enterobacter asburiae]
MSENIQQQPERAVFEKEEQLNNVIVEIFKNTGVRISKDDPVLSLLFLHEEIQKKQSSLIKEDFISLTEAFRNVLSSMEQENIQRFRNIVETCGDLDKEIKDAVDHAKNDLNETAVLTKEKLTNDLIELVSILKKNQIDANEAHEKSLNDIVISCKKNISNVKPFSKKAAIAICAACTLFVTAGLSGAFWYVTNQSKVQMEENMKFAASGFFDMQDLTKKVITQLPPAQQAKFKKELDSINKRTK